MLQNTHAFVLKINPKGETSSIVHCFSRDFGKLILIAKGAKASKSQFKGLLEPFSLLNIHFNEKKNRAYQFLSNAEYINPFRHLKGQPEAILYGSIILEILYKVQEYQADKTLFDLIKAVFTAIDNGVPATLAHWYFIMHYLQIEGLPLNTDACYHCGAPLTSAYFLPKLGYIYCNGCRNDFSLEWELDIPIMSLLKRLSQTTPEDLPEIIYDNLDSTLINRLLWNTLATRFDNCRSLQSVTILRKVL